MRSRHSCTGIGRNRCQNVRGEGVPPENGFQVKIRLSYPNRDLKFSELVGGVAEHRVFEDRRCFDGKRHRHSCVRHVFLSSDASQNMPGCSVAGQGPCREVLPGVLPRALPGACSWVFAAVLLPLLLFCSSARCFCSLVRSALLLLPCLCSAASALLFHVLWLCCAMIFLFLLFCFCPSASATCPCFSAHGLLLLLCCSCSSLSSSAFALLLLLLLLLQLSSPGLASLLLLFFGVSAAPDICLTVAAILANLVSIPARGFYGLALMVYRFLTEASPGPKPE